MGFKQWVRVNKEYVHTHKGLDHILLNNLNEYTCHDDFLKLAFQQIYHLVLYFPFHISGAISNSYDEDLLKVLIRNLYVEIGGENGVHHIEIYRRLLRALGVSCEKPSNKELWKQSIELENACRESYNSNSIGLKLGALFAFEEMSSPLVKKWDESLRNVSSLEENEFMFFTIHIDIELEHAEDIIECCRKYVDNEIFLEEFVKGRNIIMESLAEFWDELYRQGDSLIRSITMADHDHLSLSGRDVR